MLRGIDRVPTSDELKHFGAALASYGSVALFHMLGITPEAQRVAMASAPDCRCPRATIGRGAISRPSRQPTRGAIDTVDVVVFSAPQLSLLEMRRWPTLLDGRRATMPLLASTSPQVKPDADRMGLTARIEAAGGIVLSGMCFYQSYAREMAEANGWQQAGHQLRQAHQHPGRLRLSARAAFHGGLRRRGLQQAGLPP